ncbi:pleckstrin homology domain-containing family A member 3-like isoform X1 [Tribolium madens]|uniref:pleckstrin homology domain-containing family A member 3-like isoform X1 n=1 Tax=Tribolium madens TaxID=41895 RepID=UPI001CF74838|nr:pleckstrin homology domain-containing family A member 3-like isoform X1 [Tribolium madens]
MEGVLWKWTNYWNGWQTRWFILENGVLAYYKSQEEVNQGCRGSIKVQACEIIVNAIDSTRLDLVIPGEQHIYLKTATSQERQQWLVALGSAKACVQKRTLNDSSEFKVNNNCEPNTNALKKKKSELRLYCDLLMQQVHVIKNSTNGENRPDVEKMDDATRLLGATCDTFIKTLEECMELSNANIMYNVPNNDVIVPPATVNLASKRI